MKTSTVWSGTECGGSLFHTFVLLWLVCRENVAGYLGDGRGVGVVRCVRNSLARLAPTVTMMRATKIKCKLGVSLGACATVRNGRRMGLCIRRILITNKESSSFALFNFTSGRRHRLCHRLVAMSNIKNGATEVVLSSVSPDRLYGIVSANGSGVLGAIGNVKLGATRHVVVSLGSGVIDLNVTSRLPTGNNGIIVIGGSVGSRTIDTLAVLNFSPTPSTGMMISVLGTRPSLPIRRIMGLTLGRVGWLLTRTGPMAL